MLSEQQILNLAAGTSGLTGQQAMAAILRQPVYLGTTTGSANTQLLSGLTSYRNGMIVEFQAGYTNTGALTVNGKAVKLNGVDLVANQIGLGELMRLRYDGTAFQIIRTRADWFGPFLRNPVLRRFQNLALAAGDNDICTVTAGKRAFQIGAGYTNCSGGAITLLQKLKNAGTYYRAIGSSSVIANGSTSSAAGQGLRESGQGFSINTTAANLSMIWFAVVEFDNDSPLKSANVLVPANGNQAMYTCPTGFVAVGINISGGTMTVGSLTMNFNNDSGGNITAYVNIVVSGGAVVPPGTINTNSPVGASPSATATGGSAVLIASSVLTAGDYINLNLSAVGTGSVAFAQVLELPV